MDDDDENYEGGEAEVTSHHLELMMKDKECKILLLSSQIEVSAAMASECQNKVQLAASLLQQFEKQDLFLEQHVQQITDFRAQVAHCFTEQNSKLDSGLEQAEMNSKGLAKIGQQLEKLGVRTQMKLEAWETEIRDLQDKTQLKQFKIDKFETMLTNERLEKSAIQGDLKRHKKEIEILYQNIKQFWPKHLPEFKVSDKVLLDEGLIHDLHSTNSLMAIKCFKEILHENERLREDIHQIIESSLLSFYELSKYQHKLVSDGPIEEKVNFQICKFECRCNPIHVAESMQELKEIQLS